MSLIPPDPGKAIELAKISDYDLQSGCFVRAREVSGEEERRWLRPEGGSWVATCLPERRVSAETYAILHEGEPSRVVEHGIALNGSTYVLVDRGYEAVAEPV